jgi:hypothetical protein
MTFFTGCNAEGIYYGSYFILSTMPMVATFPDCQTECKNNKDSGCNFYSWSKTTKDCILYYTIDTETMSINSPDYISGNVYCSEKAGPNLTQLNLKKHIT